MGPQGDFFWAFEKEGAENGCEQKEKVAQAAQARFFFLLTKLYKYILQVNIS